MNFQDLPEEILDLCFQQSDITSLKALRLTSRHLQSNATKRLFYHVGVIPTVLSAQKCSRILQETKVNPFVRSLTFYTSEHPRARRQGYWKRNLSTDEPELPEEYEDVLYQIGRLQNLQKVELQYARECAGPGDEYSTFPEVVAENTEFRRTVLQMLLEALNDSEHPAEKVHSLGIKNLQDIVNKDLCTSTDFERVLLRLTSLSLQIATEYNDAAPEHNLDIAEPHTFYNHDLKVYWLRPLQSQLTHLKLYAEHMYWGYYPVCDMKDLHFPKLKSLALGNMTFTHDHQLDWILSHADSLESLVLDDCPIVHACKMYETFGPDRAAPRFSPRSDRPASSQNTWYYDARWHDYLPRIRKGLPHLHHFAIGHGAWDLGKAFEESENLRAHLSDLRYVIFDGGTAPSPWIEPGRTYRKNDKGETEYIPVGYDCCWREAPSFPDCGIEDQRALNDLMAVVSGRDEMLKPPICVGERFLESAEV